MAAEILVNAVGRRTGGGALNQTTAANHERLEPAVSDGQRRHLQQDNLVHLAQAVVFRHT